MQEFNDTCLELLKSLPTAIMQLNLTQTPQLSRDFVNLLTLYVQLHMFWSFVEERKVLLALYSCAYQCVHGRTEKVRTPRGSNATSWERGVFVGVNEAPRRTRRSYE